MNYNEYVAKVTGSDGIVSIPFGQLPEVWPPTMNWNRVWIFNADLLTLTHKHNHYEIDLEKLHSSAEVLDVICQVAGKRWPHSTMTIAALVRAINDLIRPQASLCSFGQDSRIEGVGKIIQENLAAIDLELVDLLV